METIKLKTAALGLKDVTEVPTTYRNQEMANQMYIDMLKLSISQTKDLSSLTGTKATKAYIEEAEKVKKVDQKQLDFTKNLLKLTNKEIEKIKDVASNQEISRWNNYAVMRFRGLTDEDIEEMYNEQQEVTEDPKDEQEGSDSN